MEFYVTFIFKLLKRILMKQKPRNASQNSPKPTAIPKHAFMLWRHRCKQHGELESRALATRFTANAKLPNRVTQCYAGNSSRSNPGSGWRTNSGLGVYKVDSAWGWIYKDIYEFVSPWHIISPRLVRWNQNSFISSILYRNLLMEVKKSYGLSLLRL